MKDMQTKQFLCWGGITDADHSITFGSNEVGSNEEVTGTQETKSYEKIDLRISIHK